MLASIKHRRDWYWYGWFAISRAYQEHKDRMTGQWYNRNVDTWAERDFGAKVDAGTLIVNQQPVTRAQLNTYKFALMVEMEAVLQQLRAAKMYIRTHWEEAP
jgi:hypothetical protein